MQGCPGPKATKNESLKEKREEENEMCSNLICSSHSLVHVSSQCIGSRNHEAGDRPSRTFSSECGCHNVAWLSWYVSLCVCVFQPEGLTNHQSSLIVFVFVFMSVCLCVCVCVCVCACVRACMSELVKDGRWLATRNFTVEAKGSYWHLFCYRRHNPTPLHGLGHQSRSANHRIRRRNG